MANIYSLEQIKEKLKDRKVSVIAEKTGLSRQEIYNVTNGKNISFATYEKLVHYLFPEAER
jgi:DNA-binding phage protein